VSVSASPRVGLCVHRVSWLLAPLPRNQHISIFGARDHTIAIHSTKRTAPTITVMVTVRNPVARLGSELYDAMQEVLDALFNTKDSEYGPTERCLDGGLGG